MNQRAYTTTSRLFTLLTLVTAWVAPSGCKHVLGIETKDSAECVKDSDCSDGKMCVAYECTSAEATAGSAGTLGGHGGASNAGKSGGGGRAPIEEAGASGMMEIEGGSAGEGGMQSVAGGGFGGDAIGGVGGNDTGSASGGGTGGTGIGGDFSGGGNSGSGGTGGSGIGGDGTVDGFGGGGTTGVLGGGGTGSVGGGASGGGGIGGQSECSEGTRRCFVTGPALPTVPQLCEGGVWKSKAACDDYCNAGFCVNSPSCSQLGAKCGPKSESCCQALQVPGGSFKRTYDAVKFVDDSYEASVSSFAMDKFEVTVGRFRKFVATYPLNKPHAGDGKTLHMPGDPGWDPTWPMPTDAATLVSSLKCPNGSWEDTPISNPLVNQRPINCVNFYVAYAFCIWEGGRLPTEAEWNYAASGGNQQRVFPWSAPPTADTISHDQAVYWNDNDPQILPSPVGSKSCKSDETTCGDGRWGHADLAGNISEWVLDYFSDPYPTTNCVDCWNTSPRPHRSCRGGSWDITEDDLYAAERCDAAPTDSGGYSGIRCVYDLK